MNTQRSVRVDAVPLAAPSVRDSSFEVPDVARLAEEIGDLSARNDRLLKSVDKLLHLHESEQAQRQSLQATLDRLLGEAGESTAARSLEAMGTKLRKGVSEDLKPLLHAIIELLELSARRVPAAPAIPPAPSEITGAANSPESVVKRDNASGRLPPEDLPGALPEILTKSVEELVGKRRAERQKTLKSKKPDADGNDPRAAFKGHRPHAWVPVTSGTFKP